MNSSLIYLRIGEAAWWERLPDGSGVSREAPAPFCEGLVGKFHGSTLRAPQAHKMEVYHVIN